MNRASFLGITQHLSLLSLHSSSFSSFSATNFLTVKFEPESQKAPLYVPVKPGVGSGREANSDVLSGSCSSEGEPAEPAGDGTVQGQVDEQQPLMSLGPRSHFAWPVPPHPVTVLWPLTPLCMSFLINTLFS